jgi:hypothetical protein
MISSIASMAAHNTDQTNSPTSQTSSAGSQPTATLTRGAWPEASSNDPNSLIQNLKDLNRKQQFPPGVGSPGPVD